MLPRIIEIEALKPKDDDNEFIAMAKGGVNAWIVGTIYLGALVVGTGALGKYIQRKKEKSNGIG